MGIAAAKPHSRLPSPRVVWGFTLCVFLLGFLARFLLADFTKSIAVYMDELRYFDIARSLWQGGGVAIRNLPEQGYNKVLYSLLISPAFAVSTLAGQTRAIAAINSLLLNSAVFPALLLAKRCIADTRWQMALVALTALMPDMAYSMTFMSEVSAFPLTLWVVLACWLALEADGALRAPVYGCAAGAASYLLYLNKEVALAFPAAFLVGAAFRLLRQKRDRQITLLSLCGYAGGFAALFLLAWLLLPGGLGTSYNQTGLAYFDSAEKWGYLLYALLFNAATAMIAFLYLPLALPLFRFRALGQRRQTLAVFCLAALAALVFIVAYSVTAREDLGEAMPRQHIRYYAPLLVPLLALSLGALADGVRFDYENKRLAMVLVAATALLAVGCVLVFLRPTAGGFVDHTLYKYLGFFHSVKRFWALKIALAAAFSLGILVVFRLQRGLAAGLLSLGLAGVLLLSNLGAVREFRSLYGVSGGDAAHITAVEVYLAENPGTLLVLLHDEYTHRENLILDTWVGSETTRFTWLWQYGEHQTKSRGQSLAQAPFSLLTYQMESSGQQLEGVDYILLPGAWALGQGASEVEVAGGIFRLYRLDDPTVLPVLERLPESE